MATFSSVGYGGSAGSAYNVYMDYSLISQDITSNTSKIRLKFWAQSSSTTYPAWNGSPQPFSITADGTKRSGTKEIDFRNRKIVNFGTEDFTISHNSDGNKTVDIKGEFTISRVNSIRGGIVTGSWKLPTIARSSYPTMSSNDITLGGTNLTVYTNSKNSSFRFDMYAVLGNRQYQFADKVYTSSILKADEIKAWADQIPNSSSRKGFVRMRTYNGNTLIGSADRDLNFIVPDSYEFNPQISSISTSIFGTGADKTLSSYVQGVSKVNASATSSAGLGASVKERYITIGTEKYSTTSATSGVLKESGDIEITAYIKDSRGRSSTSSTTISVHPYAPPKISEFVVDRINNTTRASVVRSGSWSRVGGKNTLNVRIEKAESGGRFESFSSDNYTSTTEKFSENTEITGMDELKSYEFKIFLKDTLGFETTAILGLGTSEVPMSWGKKGIGVGKIYQEQEVLEVAGNILADGKLISKGINVEDDRDTESTPNDLMDIGKVATFKFKRNSAIGNPPITATSSYSHILEVAGWTDSSGGYPTQISFGDGLAIRRGASNSSWGSWRKLAEESKYPEAGAGANGRYVRFEDGTQICFYRVEANTAFDRAYGSLWRTTITWTYQKPFSSAPSVTCSQFRWGTGLSWGGVANTGDTSAVLVGYDTAERSSGNTVISAIAVGRWK